MGSSPCTPHLPCCPSHGSQLLWGLCPPHPLAPLFTQGHSLPLTQIPAPQVTGLPRGAPLHPWLSLLERGVGNIQCVAGRRGLSTAAASSCCLRPITLRIPSTAAGAPKLGFATETTTVWRLWGLDGEGGASSSRTAASVPESAGHWLPRPPPSCLPGSPAGLHLLLRGWDDPALASWCRWAAGSRTAQLEPQESLCQSRRPELREKGVRMTGSFQAWGGRGDTTLSLGSSQPHGFPHSVCGSSVPASP